MLTEKREFIETLKYTTPEFRATWPALTVAGAMYKGKPKGKYEVKWVVNPKSEEAHTLKEHLSIAVKAAENIHTDWMLQYSPFKAVMDKDKKLTGLDSVVFSCNTMRKNVHYDIPILDDCGCRLPTDLEIWNGTLMQVRYTPQSYNTPQAQGVRFNIIAIKIIELVNSTTGAADVKDGFEFKDPPAVTERFPIETNRVSNERVETDEKDMAHDEGQDEQEVKITF